MSEVVFRSGPWAYRAGVPEFFDLRDVRTASAIETGRGGLAAFRPALRAFWAERSGPRQSWTSDQDASWYRTIWARPGVVE